MLIFLHIIISMVIILRVVCFKKPAGTSHKIAMSVLAYLIVIAAGYDIIALLFTHVHYPLSMLFFKALIASVLIKSGGNVVDLFITRPGQYRPPALPSLNINLRKKSERREHA